MTVRIALYDHPFAACAPRRFEASCVGEWLLQHYGDVPTVNVQVFRGDPSAATDVTHDIPALCGTDDAEFTVLQSPGGPYLPVISIVLTVFSVASALLASRPSMPANVNRNSASANNQLGERSNQVRLLQRIEDIYGTVRSIPSLIMPTYVKYIDNQKVEYGYYCVGRGYYSISDLKDADTLISAVPSASAAVYRPFTSPNSGDAPQLQIGAPIIDRVQTVTRSEEIDGLTLAALNQLKFPDSGQYDFATGGRITQRRKNPNFNTLLEPGDTVTVVMTPVPFSVTAPTTSSVNGFLGNFTPGGDGGGGGGDGGDPGGGDGGDGGDGGG